MSEPIRILQVVSVMNRGGAETMIMNLYRAIDRSIIQFDFVVHSSEFGAYAEEAQNMGAHFFSCPRFNGKNTIEYLHWWKTFFKDHNEYKILHSHIRSTASFYIPIAKKNGVKTIIHSHSTSDGSGISGKVKKITQLPLRHCADYLFACSDAAGKWLYGKNAPQKANYHALKNAIDVSQYAVNEDTRNRVRRAFEISPDTLLLIHVGRFCAVKNHDLLIDIFNKMQKKTNAKLMLVGDGELRDQVEEKVKRLGLQDKVIFTGVRSDVPDLLQASDVFVFPSLYEGLPVVAIEAQAAGLPCFISDRVTKEVDIAGCCMFLPIDDPKLWADAILSADLIRSDTAQQIKDAGYDIHTTAKWLEKFYLEIVKN